MGNDKNNLNLYQLDDELNQNKIIATQIRQVSQRDLNTILNLIENQHDQILVDFQSVGPVPPSRRQWSSWEDLGGIITSAA